MDEKLRAFLESDPFREFLGGKVLEVQEGYARVKAVVKREHLNFHGVAHGGFIGAVADFAFAIASNSENFRRMAVNININFYSSANIGDELVGEAEKVKGGKRVGFFKLRVWRGERGGKEELVAEGTAIVYGKGEKIIT